MTTTGIIIQKMPRKKIGSYGLEKGRVMIKTGNNEKLIFPVAQLKANRGFNRMSSEEMRKVLDKPYHGFRVGQVVEVSEEEYWD
jgi:uncharacterized protein YdaT